MGDDNQSNATSVERLKNFHYLGPGGAVQIPGGLVRQNKAGVHHGRTRNGDSLTLTSRKLVGSVVRAVGQVHVDQGLIDPTTAFRPAHSSENHRQFDVFRRTQSWHQVKKLENETDVLAADNRLFIVGQADRVPPFESVGALSRLIQQTQDIEQGGLARTRGAHQGQILARFDRQ